MNRPGMTISRSLRILTVFTAVTVLLSVRAPFGTTETMAATPTATNLTPQSAVTKALAHSPTLKAAVLEAQRSKLKVDGETDRYEPTLTSSIDYTHTARNSLAPNGVSTADSDVVSIAVGINQQFAWGTSMAAELGFSGEVGEYVPLDGTSPLSLGPGYGLDLRFSVNQPLLRGLGRDLYEFDLKVARLQNRAARSAKEQAASVAVRDVLVAYWELWYAQESYAIQRDAKGVATKQLRDAAVEVKAGAKARHDTLPLQVQVARIDEAMLAAHADIRRRQVALAKHVGTSLYQTGLSAGASLPKPVQAPLQGEAAVTAAIAEAYELQDLRTAIEQAEIIYSAAGERGKIKLDASAWIQVSGLGNGRVDDAFTQFGTLGAVSGGLGLKLELPIDRTLTDTETASARLAINSAQARLKAAEEALAAQVMDLSTALDSTADRLALAQATVALTVKALTGQQARFDNGDATALELVVAQQDKREAELRVARARVDLEVTRLSLEHLTGRLLAGLKR